MTLDLPSGSKGKWSMDEILKIIPKESTTTNCKRKRTSNHSDSNKRKKQKLDHHSDSDKDMVQDGIGSVADTRSLAERLREKVESLQKNRGGINKKDKAELEKNVKIEGLKDKDKKKKKKHKKKKTITKTESDEENDSSDEEEEEEEADEPMNGKHTKHNQFTQSNGYKKTHNSSQTATMMNTSDDEDGIEYPMDSYDSDDSEIEDSLSPELEDNLQFGTFDYSDGKPKPMYLSKKGTPRKKPLAKMIKRAEKIQEQLKDKSEEGQKKAMDYKWDKLERLMKGEKIVDDPKLLKKKAKLRLTQKKKSSLEWSQRNEQVKNDQEARIKKRETNLKAKVERKKGANLRRKLGIKKPKNDNKQRRPGFEGKKKNFIN
eukprot:TRINITY_DN1786_c0_g1_i1.p1 TRINITY_DN1786_c0_g1~~TRINITY_DN1786_c0_g1_i1.p1  ORF type:complete len:374 (-),score=118.75 TRINITY_DN1786_c0_g1_i1:20-1141(-)